MAQKQKVWQQGDVVFIEVADIPVAASKEEKFDGIVQHGEHTGHAHRLRSSMVAKKYEDGEIPELATAGFEMFQHFEQGRRYLALKEDADLSHEEHNTIKLPAGKYEVRIVRELDWFSDMERQVVD